jgi:hypothetical protein
MLQKAMNRPFFLQQLFNFTSALSMKALSKMESEEKIGNFIVESHVMILFTIILRLF